MCPRGAGRKQYNLHFINTPIELSGAIGKTPPVIDKYGLIYVIDEDMAAVKADPKKAIPLVIRANVYDCVDVLLTSEWDDDDSPIFRCRKSTFTHIFSSSTTRHRMGRSPVCPTINPCARTGSLIRR